MKEITELLAQVRDGEPQNLQAVFERLYPELRRLAATRIRGRDGTFTPTVLVHEFYLRAIVDGKLNVTDRHHFFAAAAKAMRWIVVDHARSRNAQKHGGGQPAITLTERLLATSDADTEVLALHESLQRLDQINPRQREVVELHYFAGLTFDEIADLLQCSSRTTKREWQRARAFLYSQLAEA